LVFFRGMATHFENKKDSATLPEWAQGLSEEQLAAVRLEALRQGKPPGEVVREWVLEMADKLCKPAA
jgi:hypothetical protein